MSDALVLSNLSIGYGRLGIIADLSLRLAPATTLAIVGPNGAGKTTLLKGIAGLLPTGGKINLFGQAIEGRRAFRRARAGIALVPEGRQIFSELTVEENLMVACTARPPDIGSMATAIADIYEMFPILGERRKLAGGSLSGGQQQMLALGRALVTAPKVLLLDEPTQGLAPVIVNDVARILRTQKARIAMIVVEQNRAFAEQVADTVLRMEDGVLSDA